MATDDDGTTNRTPETKPMMLQPPAETRKGIQKLRVDRDLANLIRYLQSLDTGDLAVILINVEAGRIDWRPAQFGERKQ